MDENNVNVTETVEEVVSPIEETAAEAPAEVIPSMDEFADELKSQTEKVKNGEIVSGTVTSVSDTEVTVDFGSYTEGYIPVGEYSNDPSFNVREDVTVGEAVKGLVLREDKRDLEDEKRHREIMKAIRDGK